MGSSISIVGTLLGTARLYAKHMMENLSYFMVSYSKLIEQLMYYPDTGIFIWKVSKRGPIKAGNVAGTNAGG